MKKTVKNPALLVGEKENFMDRITIKAGKRSGKPCIRGMRITVEDVLEWLGAGMSFEEIMDDFPKITKEDILAVLQYAASRERKIMIVNRKAI